MRFSALTASLLFLASFARAEEHWAYLPPVDTALPANSPVHPVDALLAGAREKAGLQPAKLAPPRNWIERAAYTVTGLPPSPEQIKRLEECVFMVKAY